MVDQQEALERQRELYQEKNEHLERFLEPVAPYEFYREIFPEGSFERKGHFEDRKGNGIAVTVQKVEVDKATGIALQIEGMVRRNGVLSLTSWTNCGSYKTLILRLCPRFPILVCGGAVKMPGIFMLWCLIWTG
jgi:hypothetical protein